MAKKKKTLDENMAEFVNQMRNAGVTEKTLKKVLQEIHEHQQKEMEIMLKEMFKNIKKHIMEDDINE